MTKVGWSLWSDSKMVEVLLERFSAVVSDVCACFMRFKVRLDQFNLGLKQLSGTFFGFP